MCTSCSAPLHAWASWHLCRLSTALITRLYRITLSVLVFPSIRTSSFIIFHSECQISRCPRKYFTSTYLIFVSLKSFWRKVCTGEVITQALPQLGDASPGYSGGAIEARRFIRRTHPRCGLRYPNMRRDLRRLGDSARQVSACVRRLVRSFPRFPFLILSLSHKIEHPKRTNERTKRTTESVPRSRTSESGRSDIISLR